MIHHVDTQQDWDNTAGSALLVHNRIGTTQQEPPCWYTAGLEQHSGIHQAESHSLFSYINLIKSLNPSCSVLALLAIAASPARPARRRAETPETPAAKHLKPPPQNPHRAETRPPRNPRQKPDFGVLLCVQFVFSFRRWVQLSGTFVKTVCLSLRVAYQFKGFHVHISA
ncbi:hypothetical protein Salat_0227400 [Sesamum alatum]|uniref:Uncharacterized protein n=1 Tax=Sesamum alatum TaxID=300844 RepID=A0AAE1Z016_9LAMI|nr:hypothetical protein Salat_0227400 [Sesamum alatum]